MQSETNHFVEALKEEMARMKEDMTKLGEARLQLEVSYDTLNEDHQDLLSAKKKVEDSLAERTVSLSDQNALIESLKEQVNDLTSKNTFSTRTGSISFFVPAF